MVSIIQRMKVMRGKLAKVRSGVGAAVLPDNVTKIALNFAFRNKAGHMGPRKFWRTHLPRLKYHNPELQVDVERSRTINPFEVAPTITIHFSDKQPAVLDVRDQYANEICKQVLELTKAKQLPVDPEDARLASEYEAYVRETEAREVAKMQRREEKRKQKEREKLGGV